MFCGLIHMYSAQLRVHFFADFYRSFFLLGQVKKSHDRAYRLCLFTLTVQRITLCSKLVIFEQYIHILCTTSILQNFRTVSFFFLKNHSELVVLNLEVDYYTTVLKHCFSCLNCLTLKKHEKNDLFCTSKKNPKYVCAHAKNQV